MRGFHKVRNLCCPIHLSHLKGVKKSPLNQFAQICMFPAGLPSPQSYKMLPSAVTAEGRNQPNRLRLPMGPSLDYIELSPVAFVQRMGKGKVMTMRALESIEYAPNHTLHGRAFLNQFKPTEILLWKKKIYIYESTFMKSSTHALSGLLL